MQLTAAPSPAGNPSSGHGPERGPPAVGTRRSRSERPAPLRCEAIAHQSGRGLGV